MSTVIVTSDARALSTLEVQANRFQLVSRLADDLAHEIKNPLHAMVINLELVKRRAQAGDVATALQRADIVAAEVQRVNGLIDQLLQLLRPARQNDPVQDVDRVVGELLPLLAQQARLSRVELVYHEIGAPVAAPIRRDALKLVLLNLFSAALERVRASGGRLEIGARQTAHEVELVVAEPGAGPSPEAAPRLVASAPQDGSAEALGMEVARHLVQDAGGLLVHEDGDGGARVALRFPRAPRVAPGA